jgi:hypothetical protein
MVLRAYAVGSYVWEDILQRNRAPYGHRVVQRIAEHPMLEMSRASLFNCISLARAYPELGSGRVPERLQGLGLSHLYILARITDPADRRWYERKAIKKRWSVRKLEKYAIAHAYARPSHADAEDLELEDSEEGPPRSPVRLQEGVHNTLALADLFEEVGPTTFRVLPSRTQTRGWDRVLLECGLGPVRAEDLCLLRAFIEIAEARGHEDVRVTDEGSAIAVSAEGMSLRIDKAQL